MNNISISELKTNPAKAIRESEDVPVVIQKRNKPTAYLVGKELFDKLINYIEDQSDRKVVESTDFSKGRDFEAVAKELGI